MPKLPSLRALQKIITEAAHVPAVGYVYVESKKESKHKFVSTSLTFGKKNAQSTDTKRNGIDDQTRFPASSLSKIVFTYLVLQLVKKKKFDLDEPLHSILPYERFKIDGEYPEKAKQLTARHVLSHTTGLPNFGVESDLSSPLLFDAKSELGKGYSYSGEAFLYLQKVIEKKMGKNLQTLAKKYVFGPLRMKHSTFLPQSKNNTNVVAVHTELGKPTSIYVGHPHLNAAGSLLTTTDDTSKFMTAWLKNMDDPIFKQAFEPTSAAGFPTCGLGWHIYRNKEEVIAYQYGEDPNTRSFMAINVKDKKGAAFFTNSENGMGIANKILSSPDLAPIGNMQAVFKHMHYSQSDEPGWKETIEGKIAEDQNNFKDAGDYFKKAFELSPNDGSKKLRLEWFNKVRQFTQEKPLFEEPLKSFVGKLTNDYNDKIEIDIRDGNLIFKQFDDEIKLVRISENEFLPEKDQSFQISFYKDRVTIHSILGWEKSLFKQPLLKSQEATTSYTAITRSLGHQTTLESATPTVALSEKKQLDTEKPMKLKQESEQELSSEHEEAPSPQPKI